MSKYLGDFAAGDTIDFKFTTFRPSTGAAYALSSGAVLSVFKNDSTTVVKSDDAGSKIVLTRDFGSPSVTGLNHVRIATANDTSFYADGSQFEVVISTGTVDSVSVVGACVGRFTLRAQAALYPTTAGRKLDVSTTGEAGIDFANIGSPTTTVNLSGTTIKAVTDGVTVASNNDKTGYSLATAPPTAAAIADAVWDETLADHLTAGSTGAGLNAAGSAGDPWSTALPGSYGAGTAGKILGDNLNATVSSRLAAADISLSGGAVTVGTINTGVITATSIADDAITAAKLATNAITNDAIATSAAEEIADAVWEEPANDHKTGATMGHWLNIIKNSVGGVEGTVTSTVTATTTVFSTDLTAANDTYDHQTILFMTGNLAGQSKPILSYAQTNGVFTLDEALTAAPQTGDEFLLIATHVHPMSIMVTKILEGATSTSTYDAGEVGNVLARLNNMIEADGGDYRYTANALEEAPSGGGGGTTFATGNVPYQVKADEQFPGGVVDILIGTLLRLDLQVLDRDDNAINLTGATVTVGVRNASTGATVGTDQSASLSLARLGYITVDTVAAWSATAGTYRLTVSATVGSDVIVAGPLQLIVRAR